jgi:hypothetical protein
MCNDDGMVVSVCKEHEEQGERVVMVAIEEKRATSIGIVTHSMVAKSMWTQIEVVWKTKKMWDDNLKSDNKYWNQDSLDGCKINVNRTEHQ